MEKSAVCIGIAGATCSGKTSLALLLHDKFCHSRVIHQDDFYKKEDSVTRSSGMCNWDIPSSLNQNALMSAVKEAVLQPHVLCQYCGLCESAVTHLVLVEGTMILGLEDLRCMFDVCFFLTLDKATCRKRRGERRYEGDDDPPEYFDSCVWPSYRLMHQMATEHHSVLLDSCCLSVLEMYRTVIGHIDVICAKNNCFVEL